MEMMTRDQRIARLICMKNHLNANMRMSGKRAKLGKIGNVKITLTLNFATC